MIPSNPDEIKKLQELADRNIANGNWGSETTIPGLPGGTIPMTPEARASRGTVSQLLAKVGKRRVSKSQ